MNRRSFVKGGCALVAAAAVPALARATPPLITPAEYVVSMEAAGMKVLAASGGIYHSWAEAREHGRLDWERVHSLMARSDEHPDPKGFDADLVRYLIETGRVA